jgi:hypothetical protein
MNLRKLIKSIQPSETSKKRPSLAHCACLAEEKNSIKVEHFFPKPRGTRQRRWVKENFSFHETGFPTLNSRDRVSHKTLCLFTFHAGFFVASIWTIDEGINYVAAQDFFVF